MSSTRPVGERLALLVPLLLVPLVLGPRLVSAQFGLLDDGATIRLARTLLTDPAYSGRIGADAGRFFPFCWIYHALVYAIGGASPRVFFAANAVLLALTAALLVRLVRMRGGSLLQAALSGCLFVLSGAVIESYYTLSKGEPIGLAFALAALVALLQARLATRLWHRWGLCAAAAAGLAIAMLSKETGLVLAPVAAGWWALDFLPLPGERTEPRYRAGFTVFALAALAALIYAVLRALSPGSTVGTGLYTRDYQFGVLRILVSGAAWACWLLRDFPFLLPLVLFIVWTLWQGRLRQTRLLADALVWMAGWMAVYLPWPTALQYFTLPLAAGASVFAGVAAGQLWSRLRSRPDWRTVTLAAVCVVLLVVTQANHVTTARFQLASDSSNAELLDTLAGLPRGSRILVSLDASNEYIYEINEHLRELHGRGDLHAESVSFPLPADGGPLLFVATPMFENPTQPLPRFGVSEPLARQAQARLAESAGARAQRVHEHWREFQSFDVGLDRVACVVLKGGLACNYPRPFIHTSQLRLGWRLDRIAPSPASVPPSSAQSGAHRPTQDLANRGEPAGAAAVGI